MRSTMAYSFRLLLFLYLGVLWVHGAKRINVKKRMAEGLNEWREKRSNLNEQKPSLEQTIGLPEGEDLQPTDSIHTKAGNTKTKYKQMYNGVEIVGQSVVIETDGKGELTGEIDGNLVEGIIDDVPSTTPQITKWQALSIALENEGDDKHEITFNPINNAKLAIEVQETGDPDNVDTHLSWEINYFINTDKISRPFYVIDAMNGKIMNHWQGIDSLPSKYFGPRRSKRSHLLNKGPGSVYGFGGFSKESGRSLYEDDSGKNYNDINSEVYDPDCRKGYTKIGGVGGNLKSGILVFGRDFPLLEVKKQEERCHLENEVVTVVDLRDFQFIYDDFFDENGTWNDTAWYTAQTMMRKAHIFDCTKGNIDEVNGGYSPLNDAYHFSNVVYQMFQEWFGITPLKNMSILARVHEDMQNAYWDGESITLGDGGSMFYPLTSLDVVAHELGHGFTEHHSGLRYWDQSGGMNEAYSDMAGEAAEHFLTQEDWHIGKTIMKNRIALRFMAEPENDNKSIGHTGGFCPGIDVHYSSGLFNRAYYLLANQPGWTVRKAFEVFTIANMLYWTPMSSFVEGACGAVKAASDLGYDVNQVKDSFRKVGIEPCKLYGRDLLSMYALKGKAGSNTTFLWNIESHVKEAHIFIKGSWWDDNDDLDLYVYSPDYVLESAAVNRTFEEVTITNPSPGPHRIVIHAKDDYMYVGLTAAGKKHQLSDDASAINQTNQLSFEISPQDFSSYSTVLIRAIPVVNETCIFVMRYEEPVDMLEWKYDYYSISYYDEDWNVKYCDLTMCKPKAGTWYLAVVWGQASEFSQYQSYYLQRLTEPGGQEDFCEI